MDATLSIRTVHARAMLVGDSLDLKSLKSIERLATSPLTVPMGGGGVAVLFRYGVAVLFDVGPVEEAAFLKSLRPLVEDALDEPEWTPWSRGWTPRATRDWTRPSW